MRWYRLHPRTRDIGCQRLEFSELIWNDQQDLNSFGKLNKIQIIGCDALFHVFPVAVAKGFRQLQVLEISTSNIEKIVKESDSQDFESDYLEKLIESKCDRLKTILLSSVLFQISSSLRVLNISSCHKLKEVFANKNEDDVLGEISFLKLEELKLEDLPWLTNFCKLQLQLSLIANITCDWMSENEDIFRSGKLNHNTTK